MTFKVNVPQGRNGYDTLSRGTILFKCGDDIFFHSLSSRRFLFIFTSSILVAHGIHFLEHRTLVVLVVVVVRRPF